MKNYDRGIPELTMGLDLGDRNSTYSVINREGELIEEGKLKTSPEVFKWHFQARARMRVVMEAGAQSVWVSRVVRAAGHEVVVGNPRKFRLIYENRSKDDRVDSGYLARVGRLDPELMAPIEHRSQEAQEDLQLLRSRDQLVKVRTQLINHVRSAVKTTGERLPACSAETFHRKVGQEIPRRLAPILQPLLAQIGALSGQIRRYDKQIARWAKEKYPQCQALEAIKGVGATTALAYVLTLQDPHRFRKSRLVGAFLGFCPGRDQSGDQNPARGITKEGDAYLRRLLINCAHYILGPFGEDCDLRRHGEKILRAGGGKAAKKRAVVAVARKLSILMHRLWITQHSYDPFYNTRRKEGSGEFSCVLAQDNGAARRSPGLRESLCGTLDLVEQRH